MKRKAIIISVSGKHLSRKEKNLIKKEKPWGLILFKRNISTLNQTKKLIKSIRSAIGDKKFPILIDEEGGSVCRLENFFDNSPYSQKFFGDLYKKNKKFSISIYKNYIFSICSIFKNLGINVNTVPLLDILTKNTHKIIGSRSYSSHKNVIKALGSLCTKIYKKNKIATVIKHIPGHGRASSDSHLTLPVVKDSYKKLRKLDFDCFRGVQSYFAMTAHILYKNIDNKNPATHSRVIIKDIIRNKIGFKGIIISDDISMKALKYDIVTNAKKSLEAGCNLALYCSGKYKDSSKLLKQMPLIDKFTLKKTSEFYKFLS
jgi:beta-N-acetylhexosaminidase